MQFHLLSFEGPDPYARVGGLASRVEGLTESLAALGFETHLWYIGDPERPGHEAHDELHYHRWAQWISRHHPGGVYDGEQAKCTDFARSLPPYLLAEHLAPHLRAGGRAVVMAEEWQTVDAVLHLDRLLRERGLRERVEILWNANNTYGFEQIPWPRLQQASRLTTVSRYMKQRMWAAGVDPVVVPNGLPADAFEDPEPAAVRTLRVLFCDRTLLVKMARWSADKRWMTAIGTVADLKRRGWRPLLVARGGTEPYGEEVRALARELGLRWVERSFAPGGSEADLLEALAGVDDADVVSLRAHLGPVPRRLLLRGADAVLANSVHEPFGLVGLEAMAVGGLACTGSSGEDYVLPGQNAVMLETDDPAEFQQLYGALRSNPRAERAMRRAGRWTAKRFAWPEVLQGVFLPRLNGGVPT